MTKPRILSYRTTRGNWSNYYGKLPENVTAVVVSRTMTLEELEKEHPGQFPKIKAIILKREEKK